MMNKNSFAQLAAVLLATVSGPFVQADTIQTEDFAITQTGDALENTPVVGSDSVGEMVVYSSTSLLGGGDTLIFYQRIDKTGAPAGIAIQISTGITDDQLNDVSNGRIVYTAYADVTAAVGDIVVADTQGGPSRILTPNSVEVAEARIDGDVVVWVQGPLGAQEIMYYDLTWPVGDPPLSIAGPAPSARQVEIGDELVVWREDVGAGEIWGMLRNGFIVRSIETNPSVASSDPATSGTLVTWAEQDTTTGARRIAAHNWVSRENRVVADDGSDVFYPAMDGDYVAYESNRGGNFDIYVHRLSDSTEFQVTTSPREQRLNSVFGDKIAYLDLGTSSGSGIDVGLTRFTINQAPVVDGGEDQTVVVGDTVSLTATATDPEGDAIAGFTWSLDTRPKGSSAVLTGAPGSAATSFVPDFAGVYVLSVTATDGTNTSLPATVVVTAEAGPPPVPDIDLSPMELNFGSVPIGEFRDLLTTLSNQGDATLHIIGDPFIVSGSSPDFDVGLMVRSGYLPGESEDVGVTYTPTTEGPAIGWVGIRSDDPDEPEVQVMLIGEGVSAALPPAEQVVAIIDFMNTAFAAGTLSGTGNGSSPNHRFGALVNMIEASGDLIVSGDFVNACSQLADALAKTDGVVPPPDFVTGPSAPELAALIAELRSTLSCP